MTSRTDRIIVTGGSGFLGRHLCRRLSSLGFRVLNIDLRPNDEVETRIADIKDASLMLKHIKDATAVFHLAALIEAGESVKFPQLFIDTNVSATLNVLEAMRVNGINNFLFSSSAAVYGEPLRTPIEEDDRTIPINPYGMTKLAMEGLVSSYVAAHQMTGVALRYFNLYGPEEHHQPETHAIPRFISQIRNGEPVTVWGSGQHLRDFIYIDDVVAAHEMALQYSIKNPGAYHYFNLSAEQPNAVKDLIVMLEKLMGKQANIQNFPDRPGDPLVLTANCSKAHKLLSWHHQVKVEEGLKRTVAYFNSIEKS